MGPFDRTSSWDGRPTVPAQRHGESGRSYALERGPLTGASFFARLPGVDEAMPARPFGRLRRGGERGGDQPARLGRVDHVVELEQRRGVEGLGVLLRRRGHLAYALLALLLVGDRLELLAQ